MKTAGIIGGSGYIGSYVTQKFLDQGFRVKVSATDPSNEDKYRHLRNLRHAENLDIVPLDVRDKSTLGAFLEGCDVVVHGGTPFQLDVKDPDSELFEPTVSGTEHFLQALKAATSVKKVVVIASVASFNTSFPMPAPDRRHDHLYVETDEPFLGETDHPYARAKYYADQVVQKFVSENPDPGYEIINVYPVMVMGPSLSTRGDSTSMGMQFLIKNGIAPNPFVQMLFDTNAELAVVDVRDVAEAIYRAAEVEGLHGKKYYLSHETWPISGIAAMLNGQEPQGNPRHVYSSKAAVADLGIRFRPAGETFHDYSNPGAA